MAELAGWLLTGFVGALDGAALLWGVVSAELGSGELLLIGAEELGGRLELSGAELPWF